MSVKKQVPRPFISAFKDLKMTIERSTEMSSKPCRKKRTTGMMKNCLPMP
jgi:hypothetical protein